MFASQPVVHLFQKRLRTNTLSRAVQPLLRMILFQLRTLFLEMFFLLKDTA